MNPQHNRPHKPEYEKISLEKINRDIKDRVEKINSEFEKGFDFIKKYHKSVTFFGSARTLETESDYILAKSLAKRIVTELPEYAVISGGSMGIMEAANRGAYEGGGMSLGLNIRLPQEQAENKYLTNSLDFDYFFTRKVCLAFSAEAFVYLPGGFGTLDELFEILTLIQTGKIDKRPIILFGKDYWQKLDDFIKKALLASEKIDKEDVDLYTITDDENKVIDMIKKAPIKLS